MKTDISELDAIAREACQNTLMLLIESLVGDAEQPTAEEALALSVCLLISIARLQHHLQSALKNGQYRANVRSALDYFLALFEKIGLDKNLDSSIIKTDDVNVYATPPSTPTQGGPRA
jgi:hypothetical protein